MRADQLLVARGLAASRSQAARLIAGGLRWRAHAAQPWRTVAKSGEELPEGAELELVDGAEARYVSRGGLKLEGALAATGVAVAGRLCLDVGQSTGGFTDCLLQQGAAHVVGVDVGHGQLHARLAADARVTAIEKCNARALEPAQLRDAPPFAGGAPMGFDLVVGDLSFISLTLVLPALAPLLRPGGDLLMLVKPQFELQPAQIGKGGIVRDAALYDQVQARLREAALACGLRVRHWLPSPIVGGDGNREFFIHARQGSSSEGGGDAPATEL
ncbi:TlyA family RNA methyltransferase [Xenophilus sp. Marseille-Q4582]|uniref:TlyA family RNA methyltransferase n=1 Tax=Xenophilus sp. Marseille-Q4582 TaxID=2866600 RepID=UPI001CE4359E|nr:TlyA family RNA methyltransferase [Xenophilus sp. Marseille-Q4582]